LEYTYEMFSYDFSIADSVDFLILIQ
jgi:hypothetical protein